VSVQLDHHIVVFVVAGHGLLLIRAVEADQPRIAAPVAQNVQVLLQAAGSRT
jgi:hypothetical protein